jgi:hypothetical protein
MSYQDIKRHGVARHYGACLQFQLLGKQKQGDLGLRPAWAKLAQDPIWKTN